MPVIGYLSTRSSDAEAPLRTPFLQSLETSGFVVGRNVAVEYRFADGQEARLPVLVAELLRLQVTLLTAFGRPTALAAKAATATVPIVFASGLDPVMDGLVTSLNRPGGNATGVSLLTTAPEAKRLGLRVIGIRRRVRSHRYVDEVFDLRDLHRALRQADFIFVAAPLTPESRNLLDKNMLSSVKAGAGLINVGRAGVVDYDAVRVALKSGALAGAVLDVFEQEPLPSSSPLWRTPNLILMPHCSSDDLALYMPLTLDLVFENARRLMAGRLLKNRVNPRRGY
jgi:hypothetical protein